MEEQETNPILLIAQKAIKDVIESKIDKALSNVGLKGSGMNQMAVIWGYDKESEIDRAMEFVEPLYVNCFWNEEYFSLTISPTQERDDQINNSDEEDKDEEDQMDEGEEFDSDDESDKSDEDWKK